MHACRSTLEDPTSGTFSIGPGGGGGGGGGGCASPSHGPDVIVGDITDVLNATAAGGLDALALGTTSCNIGDTVLHWTGSTPAHPAISGALYRYKVVGGVGHFEQVGISWLKHGFAALTGSLCCTCSPPGTSQLLGVGCSDPYGAGLNGSQSGLGPRWQVNAHTGVFTYPPANPAWSGQTARRCEVALSDLEATGGTTHYYGECTYVTSDDSAAGNNDNNSSWREITVSGGPANYNFALLGATQRTEQALRRWPVLEPGVVLSDVHVEGDGLFLVGSHATALGGGQYHYEYAVMNMNSDRNGGTFAVPIGDGVVASNLEFHGVTYRNGDGIGNVNVSSSDWTATAGSGMVRWACEEQAVNANANALRWGTTYNFRFDANVAPGTGNVTLGLWKSGGVGRVYAAAEVPGGGPSTFAYCFGDGSGTACPCGNSTPGSAHAGCRDSLGTGGHLVAAGSSSIAGDTFQLQGSGMPNGPVLYFQGTGQVNGGDGAMFGDGLRCAGGAIVRLAIVMNAGGASSYPGGGDPAIHVTGSTVAGSVRTYQGWFRDTASFCAPEGYNLTNAVQTTWAP